MALSGTSKAQLTALLAPLVAKDPATIQTLGGVARRLLNSTDSPNLLAILPTDGWSATANSAGATALAALIADIAAN